MTVRFDPNSYYNATTGRYQPTIAGYYQFNAYSINNTGVANQTLYASFYKNGVQQSVNAGANSAARGGVSISDIIYLNGTTDYVEVGFNVDAGSYNAFTPTLGFSGSLITQQNIINTTTGNYNISQSTGTTIPAMLAAVTPTPITDVVGNQYVITNSNPVNSGINIVLTATAFTGYQAWISQSNSTSITLTPGSVAEIMTTTVGTGYQIVNISPNNNVNSVAFGAKGPVASVNIGTVATYPTCKINLPQINTLVGNPQNYYDVNASRFTPKTAGTIKSTPIYTTSVRMIISG